MKLHRRYLLCALALAWPLTLSAQVVVSNTTYTSGQTITTASATTLSTSGTVAVNSGANITFTAVTKVTLAPGFRVASGGQFRALVGAALDTDGDGLPNAWEATHGLNAGAGDAGGDPDSDGVSNLAEYQLGTTPTTAAQTDSTNQTDLKIHRPN